MEGTLLVVALIICLLSMFQGLLWQDAVMMFFGGVGALCWTFLLLT